MSRSMNSGYLGEQLAYGIEKSVISKRHEADCFALFGIGNQKVAF